LQCSLERRGLPSFDTVEDPRLKSRATQSRRQDQQRVEGGRPASTTGRGGVSKGSGVSALARASYRAVVFSPTSTIPSAGGLRGCAARQSGLRFVAPWDQSETIGPQFAAFGLRSCGLRLLRRAIMTQPFRALDDYVSLLPRFARFRRAPGDQRGSTADPDDLRACERRMTGRQLRLCASCSPRSPQNPARHGRPRLSTRQWTLRAVVVSSAMAAHYHSLPPVVSPIRRVTRDMSDVNEAQVRAIA